MYLLCSLLHSHALVVVMVVGVRDEPPPTCSLLAVWDLFGRKVI